MSGIAEDNKPPLTTTTGPALSPARQKVKAFLDQVPEDRDVNSDGDTAGLFTKLTGRNHEDLKSIWANEEAARKKARERGASEREILAMPNTTTCNELAIKVGHQIATPVPLGQFYLDKALAKAGFGAAWVSAESGEKPELGDVFVMKSRAHIGVSYAFVGDQWRTVESGQGGYSAKHDIVKRKSTQWNPAKLAGWVNLDALVQLARPSPDWLKGWWEFDLDGTKFWLYFTDKPRVKTYDKRPNVKIQAFWSPLELVRTLSEDGSSVSVDFEKRGGLVVNLRQNGPDALLGNRNGVPVKAVRPT